MIGLLIQDNAYEQDIRELLMSFYPGETYAHEVKEDVDFYVQTQLENGEASIGTWEKPEEKEMKEAGEKEADKSALKMSAPEGLKDWNLSCFSWGKADLSDHSATKNVIKKLFYQMLVKRTGHELPWGSLTGIRPTKIALSRLEAGWKEEEPYEDSTWSDRHGMGGERTILSESRTDDKRGCKKAGRCDPFS